MAITCLLPHLFFLLRLSEAGIWNIIADSNKQLLSSSKPEGTFTDSAADQIKDGDILVSHTPPKSSANGPVYWHRRLWMTRVVPYVIEFVGSETAAQTIRDAMTYIESVSCLKFRQKTTSDKNWLEFYKGMGCFSPIGRNYYSSSSSNRISLGENCIYKPIVIHEILHSLGFYHEQSRRDRDSYVKIYYDRIQKGMESNFEKANNEEVDTLEQPYDLRSIMHYDKTSFTTNGQNTVESKFDPNMELGNTMMSPIDISEINEMYQCNVSSGWSRWFGWSACIATAKGCKRSKVRYCVGNDASQCPGADSYGAQDLVEECSSCVEKVDGQWNTWESFQPCSKSCDWGVRRRSRKCDNPPPSSGGRSCSGSNAEVEVCRLKRCAQSAYDTDFENGFGSWTSKGPTKALTNAESFVRRRGPGPVPRTGPRSDHTSGNGFYAVLPGKRAMYNMKAQLVSAKILPSSKRCLIFHYQLNGEQVNPAEALTVFIADENGQYLNLPFSLGGHQGNYWKRAALDIPAMTRSFKIEFEAKLGYDERSEVALDDIFLDEKPCPKGLADCQDLRPYCLDWSKIGECEKNSVFMARECCQSCSALGECKDSNKSCKGWSSRGECSKNPRWMWHNCCLSCKGEEPR